MQPSLTVTELRSKVQAALDAGQQVDFFEALAADKGTTKAMLVMWMLAPAQQFTRLQNVVLPSIADDLEGLAALEGKAGEAARRVVAALSEFQPEVHRA